MVTGVGVFDGSVMLADRASASCSALAEVEAVLDVEGLPCC